MSARIRVYGVVVLIGLCTLSWVGYRWFLTPSDVAIADESAGGNRAGNGSEPVPVESVPAKVGPIASFVSSTANLKASREVFVASRVDGIVRQVLVEEGDVVREGTRLCLFDGRELQARLSVMETQLEQVQTQLKKAELQEQKASLLIRNAASELDRQERAFVAKLVAEEEVATVRYRFEELQHDEKIAHADVIELGHRLEELQREIAQLRIQISHTVLQAPFSGTITQRLVEAGQAVRTMERAFQLAELTDLQAEVHLSESSARLVRPGQRAEAQIEFGEAGIIEGRVLRISPIVDDTSGTVKVTVKFPGQSDGNSFKPGTFVQVRIQTDSRDNVVLVPKRSVVYQEGNPSVFVVEGETAARRKVVIGYETDREVEIREGILAEEEVVVAGQGNLEDGSKIRESES